MKKIMISALTLISCASYATNCGNDLLCVPTYTQVNQINKGIFGYKHVDTNKDTKGNIITVCENPGIHKCKTSAAIANSDLTADELAEVETMVMSKISPSSLNGSFIYNTNFLVKFEVGADTRALNYIIYTRAEATLYGFEF